MKYAITLAVGFVLSASVFAVEVPLENILIVEIQTGSTDSASEEFVELYNPNSTVFDLTGWLLQYKSATGENWSTKAELEDEIEPRARYLLTSTGYMIDEGDQEFSAGLASSAGHVRLVQPALDEESEDKVHDLVGWGESADSAEGDLPTSAPDKSESLKRVVDEDGYFIDTDINFDDFEISVSPSPVSENSEVVEDKPVGDESIDDEEVFDEEPATTEEVEDEAEVLSETIKPKVYDKVQITELFIDPSSPKTDADDEFIELFNPNKESVQLEGYVVQTGNTFSRSFVLPELSIPPKQYLALYSLDTGLPLSNSGSQARILDPEGNEVFKTAPYEKAKSDTSWVLVSGKWLWSAQVTPGKANVVVVPASTSRKSSSSSSKSKSKSKSSRSRSSKSSGVDGARIVYEEPATIADSEINTAVLFGVGALAFGYAIYEYRHDISNRYHQARRYFKSRH